MIVWAFLIHQPWIGGPLDHTDFVEWMPLLRQSENPIRQLVALHEYYVSTYGRFFPLQLSHIVVRWPLFGDEMLGWQLTSFALMAAVLSLAAVTLRRLGADTFGALAGASLFAAGRIVFESWGVRVPIMESLSLLFVLLAVLLAADYRASPSPARNAVGIGLCVVLAAWVKETAVTLLPFLLLLASCYSADKRWTQPAVRRRDLALFGIAVAIVFVGAVVPTLVTYAGVPETSYTDISDRSPITPGRVVLFVMGMFFPSNWGPDLANLILYVMIGAGVLAGAWRLARPESTLWSSLTALSLPLTGSAVYLMFGQLNDYYSLPFLFGIALLFALSVTWLRCAGGTRIRLLVLLAWMITFAELSRSSWERSATATARRHVYAAASRAIATLGPDAEVAIVGRQIMPSYVDGYVRGVLRAAPPRLRVTTCPAVVPQLVRGAVDDEAIVIYENRCSDAALLNPDLRIERLASYVTSRLGWQTDTLGVSLWLPRR